VLAFGSATWLTVLLLSFLLALENWHHLELARLLRSPQTFHIRIWIFPASPADSCSRGVPELCLVQAVRRQHSSSLSVQLCHSSQVSSSPGHLLPQAPSGHFQTILSSALSSPFTPT
ncbi:mCG1038525, partial [Mus musculus]